MKPHKPLPMSKSIIYTIPITVLMGGTSEAWLYTHRLDHRRFVGFNVSVSDNSGDDKCNY